MNHWASIFQSGLGMLSLNYWRHPRKRIWAKSICLILSLSLQVPFLTWAFDRSAYAAAEPSVRIQGNLLTVPSELGTLQDSYSAGADSPWVVYIQDLHCNYEVQSNIAKMIDRLAAQNHLQLVAVEGASLPINVTKLSRFSLAWGRCEISDVLLKEGKISGPEAYAASGSRKIHLEGIEHADLYEADRTAVMKFLNDESQGLVFDLQEALNDIKPTVYSTELQALDAQIQAFRDGRLSLLKYSLYLSGQAVRLKLGMQHWPNVAAYASARQDRMSAQVDSDALYGEIEQMTRSLHAALATTPQQRELEQMEHRLGLIEKLLNISAKPEELAEFRSQPEAFRVKAFSEFIQRFDPAFEMDAEIAILDRNLNEAKEFYRIADARSKVFAENLAAKMKQRQLPLAVLITGGYHAQETLAALKQQGFSYLNVKPCITRQDVANPYFSLLRNQRTPLEKLLAQNQNIFALAPAFPQTEDPEQTLADLASQPETVRLLDQVLTTLERLALAVDKAERNWNDPEIASVAGAVKRFANTGVMTVEVQPGIFAVLRKPGSAWSQAEENASQVVPFQLKGWHVAVMNAATLAGMEKSLEKAPGAVTVAGLARLTQLVNPVSMAVLGGSAAVLAPGTANRQGMPGWQAGLSGLGNQVRQTLRMTDGRGQLNQTGRVLAGAGIAAVLAVVMAATNGPVLLALVTGAAAFVATAYAPSLLEQAARGLAQPAGLGKTAAQARGSLASLAEQRLRDSGFSERHPAMYALYTSLGAGLVELLSFVPFVNAWFNRTLAGLSKNASATAVANVKQAAMISSMALVLAPVLMMAGIGAWSMLASLPVLIFWADTSAEFFAASHRGLDALQQSRLRRLGLVLAFSLFAPAVIYSGVAASTFAWAGFGKMILLGMGLNYGVHTLNNSLAVAGRSAWMQVLLPRLAGWLRRLEVASLPEAGPVYHRQLLINRDFNSDAYVELGDALVQEMQARGFSKSQAKTVFYALTELYTNAHWVKFRQRFDAAYGSLEQFNQLPMERAEREKILGEFQRQGEAETEILVEVSLTDQEVRLAVTNNTEPTASQAARIRKSLESEELVVAGEQMQKFESTAITGTGRGLGDVQRRVEKSNGRLSFQTVGGQTTFSVSMNPQAKAAKAATPVVEEKPAAPVVPTNLKDARVQALADLKTLLADPAATNSAWEALLKDFAQGKLAKGLADPASLALGDIGDLLNNRGTALGTLESAPQYFIAEDYADYRTSVLNAGLTFHHLGNRAFQAAIAISPFQYLRNLIDYFYPSAIRNSRDLAEFYRAVHGNALDAAQQSALQILAEKWPNDGKTMRERELERQFDEIVGQGTGMTENEQAQLQRDWMKLVQAFRFFENATPAGVSQAAPLAGGALAGLPVVAAADLKIRRKIGEGVLSTVAYEVEYAGKTGAFLQRLPAADQVLKTDKFAYLSPKELARREQKLSDDIRELRQIQGLTYQGHAVAPEVYAAVRDANGKIVGFITEYVRGRSLTDLVNNGSLTEAELEYILAQAKAQLDLLHTAKLAHGDPNRMNLLVDMSGVAPVARWIDFGLNDASWNAQDDLRVFNGTVQSMRKQQLLQTRKNALQSQWLEALAGLKGSITAKEDEMLSIMREDVQELIIEIPVEKRLQNSQADEYRAFIAHSALGETAKQAVLAVLDQIGGLNDFPEVVGPLTVAGNQMPSESGLASVLEDYWRSSGLAARHPLLHALYTTVGASLLEVAYAVPVLNIVLHRWLANRGLAAPVQVSESLKAFTFIALVMCLPAAVMLPYGAWTLLFTASTLIAWADESARYFSAAHGNRTPQERARLHALGLTLGLAVFTPAVIYTAMAGHAFVASQFGKVLLLGIGLNVGIHALNNALALLGRAAWMQAAFPRAAAWLQRLEIGSIMKERKQEQPMNQEKVTGRESQRIMLLVNHPWLQRMPKFAAAFWAALAEMFSPIAGKYRVETATRDGFPSYRFTDLKSGSSFEIVPGFANKIVSLIVNGEEILHLDKVQASGGIEVMYPFMDRVAGNTFTYNGRTVDLNDQSLVERGITKKDGAGTVYHGMARRLPWRIDAIRFGADGIAIQSSLSNVDHPEIAKRFGPGRIELTYRLSGGALTSRIEMDNASIATTGSHPWIKRGDGEWHYSVPASREGVMKDMIPTGEYLDVAGRNLDVQNLTLADRNRHAVLTDLAADANGKIVSRIYNAKNGTLIEVEQETNMPFVVLWDKEEKFFAVEPVSSPPDALNDVDGRRGLKPITDRHFATEVVYRVRKVNDADGQPLRPEQVAALAETERAAGTRMNQPLMFQLSERMRAYPVLHWGWMLVQALGVGLSGRNWSAAADQGQRVQTDANLRLLAAGAYAEIPAELKEIVKHPGQLRLGELSLRRHGMWNWLKGQILGYGVMNRNGMTTIYLPAGVYRVLLGKTAGDGSQARADRMRAENWLQHMVKYQGLRLTAAELAKHQYAGRQTDRELEPAAEAEPGYVNVGRIGGIQAEGQYWQARSGRVTLTGSQLVRLALQQLPGLQAGSRAQLQAQVKDWLVKKPSVQTMLNALESVAGGDAVLGVMRAQLRDTEKLGEGAQTVVVNGVLANLVSLMAETPAQPVTATLAKNAQVKSLQVLGLPQQETEALLQAVEAGLQEMEKNPAAAGNAGVLKALAAALRAAQGKAQGSVTPVLDAEAGAVLTAALSQLPENETGLVGNDFNQRVFAVNQGVQEVELQPGVTVAQARVMELTSDAANAAGVQAQVQAKQLSPGTMARLFTKRAEAAPMREQSPALSGLMRRIAPLFSGRLAAVAIAMNAWAMAMSPAGVWADTVKGMPAELSRTKLVARLEQVDVNSKDPVAVAYRELARTRTPQARAELAKVMLRMIKAEQGEAGWEAGMSSREWLAFSEFLKGLGSVPMLEIAEADTTKAGYESIPEGLRSVKVALPMALLEVKRGKGALGFMTRGLEQGPFSVNEEIIRLFLQRGLMRFGAAA